ncbi:MAG: PKD domain-containing protein, partial [Notoacmeibacter sp.]
MFGLSVFTRRFLLAAGLLLSSHQIVLADGGTTQTITFDSSAPSGAEYGGSYTVEASSDSDLEVQFEIEMTSGSLCSLSNQSFSDSYVKSATVSFDGVGICTIKANQAGDDEYAAADQDTQSFDIGQASQSILFEDPADRDFVLNGTVLLEASGGDSNNAVMFSSMSLDVCSVLGSTVTMLGAGECFIEANQMGNTNYKDADPVSQSFMLNAVNRRPVAIPGSDRDVTSGQTVTLDGTGSTDADNDELTFRWFDSSEELLPSADGVYQFTAPTLDEGELARDLVFYLQVFDGKSYSAVAPVTITVKKPNTAPVANAGDPQIVQSGAQVTLFGSGTDDDDDEIVSALWTAPNGISLDNPSLFRTSFVAPPLGNGETSRVLTFYLTVNDGTVNSAPDFVTVRVTKPNTRPVANPGSDRDVTSGQTVTLDGTGSTD